MEIKIDVDVVLSEIAEIEVEGIKFNHAVAATSCGTARNLILMAFQEMDIDFEEWEFIHTKNGKKYFGCVFNPEEIKAQCPRAYEIVKKKQKDAFDEGE